jgi:hypothetical protein
MCSAGQGRHVAFGVPELTFGSQASQTVVMKLIRVATTTTTRIGGRVAVDV